MKMENIKAIKINRLDGDLLGFKWSNGSESVLSITDLRDNCPCAQCTSGDKGKSRMEQWVQNSLKEHRYTLNELKTVGNYALCPIWADGHDIGIYRWEYLYELSKKTDNNE